MNAFIVRPRLETQKIMTQRNSIRSWCVGRLLVGLVFLAGCHGWSLNSQRALCQRPQIKSSTTLSVAFMPVFSNSTFVDNEISDQYQVQRRSLNVPKLHQQQLHDRFYQPSSKRWYERFHELKHFYEQHGHSDPDGPHFKSLASWVRNQRTYYKYLSRPGKQHMSFLTADGIDKLESIGFVWNAHDANWEKKFAELVEFKKRFGHSNVPTPCKEYPKLSAWVSSQRYKYKHATTAKMTDEQTRKLESIGFLFHPKEIVWWNMYNDLVLFKKEHGHCDVPQQYRANKPLGVWVRHLRWALREYVLSVSLQQKVEGVYTSGLNEERLEALRALDFCWLPDPRSTDFTPPPGDIFDYSYNSN